MAVPGRATIQQWAGYVNDYDGRDWAVAEKLSSDQAIVFNLTQRLDAGEEFEVRVEFTDGVVDGQVQPWQRRADEAAAARAAEAQYRATWGPIAGVGLGGLGLLLFLGGPASLYALWYRFGRDKPVEMVADYLPEPPDELPPGMVGTLIDEMVDMEDIIATLVDLRAAGHHHHHRRKRRRHVPYRL